MLAYLAVSTTSPRPLSKLNFYDWNTLSRDRLVYLLCHALRVIGLDTSQFNRHSHWKSSAFMSYIRTPKDYLTAVSAILSNMPIGP